MLEEGAVAHHPTPATSPPSDRGQRLLPAVSQPRSQDVHLWALPASVWPRWVLDKYLVPSFPGGLPIRLMTSAAFLGTSSTTALVTCVR